MIISDQRFGSELVTTKGKIYKFDAIECMVPELLNKGADQFAYTVVTDYANPGKLMDAHNLNFLISQDLLSPMGRNLSAHSTTKLDPSISDVTWYQWSEILEQFR
jgi:copper chaperone NosL